MAVYDSFARFYDRLFAPAERRFLGRWRRETLSLIPEGSRLLELGAGTGANFEFYALPERVVSSEISCEMLAFAAVKARGNALIQANAEELPFAADSFDAAFATLVFCSIPRPELAFADLRRVVRPGGSVVLLEHVRPPGLLGRVFDVVNFATVALIDDHFNRRTAEVAVSSGLRLIENRRKLAGVVNLIVLENPD
ncbi:MAG: methyltransferase domain-containing protein [Acidobacteria bacterium]|nr:methyltransferase domain-containing protein [Acidobacteriota bacterium]